MVASFFPRRKVAEKVGKIEESKNFLSPQLFLINWEVEDSQKGQYLFADTFELLRFSEASQNLGPFRQLLFSLFHRAGP